MKSALVLVLPLALAGLGAPAGVAAAPATPARPAVPIRADHPLLGAWQITTRDDQCVETWRIDRAGTMLVTSADEVAEARFTIADQPSARGYFKWVNTIVKDNGKKDCGGNITKAPRSATNYLLLNPAGNEFILCQSEEGRQCLGPFIRVEGGEI
jgi:hypothetical protein